MHSSTTSVLRLFYRFAACFFLLLPAVTIVRHVTAAELTTAAAAEMVCGPSPACEGEHADDNAAYVEALARQRGVEQLAPGDLALSRRVAIAWLPHALHLRTTALGSMPVYATVSEPWKGTPLVGIRSLRITGAFPNGRPHEATLHEPRSPPFPGNGWDDHRFVLGEYPGESSQIHVLLVLVENDGSHGEVEIARFETTLDITIVKSMSDLVGPTEDQDAATALLRDSLRIQSVSPSGCLIRLPARLSRHGPVFAVSIAIVLDGEVVGSMSAYRPYVEELDVLAGPKGSLDCSTHPVPVYRQGAQVDLAEWRSILKRSVAIISYDPLLAARDIDGLKSWQGVLCVRTSTILD